MIRKTFNRFFSILMISLIGVAFMMGLFSTRTIMEYNVDHYDDENKLQDFQLYSSYGFDNEDVRLLRKQEFVDTLFASKMVDCYLETKSGVQMVCRVEELQRNMNKFELVSGRMPKADNEIVLVYNTLGNDLFHEGDKVKLYLEGADILDSLGHDEYVIVGFAKAPSYMAKTLETSTMKNLALDIVAYANFNEFKADYYTTVYFTVKDSAEYDSFSRSYADFIDDVRNDVETYASNNQDRLKESIRDKYLAEIQDGEQQLELARNEGQSKLDEAKRKLDEANIQIIAGESQLQTLNTVLQTAINRQKALESQYSNDSYKQIREIEQNDPDKRSFDEIYSELNTDYGTYNALKRMKENGSSSSVDNLITQLENDLSSQKQQKKDLESERSQLEKQLATASGDQMQQITQRLTEIENELAVVETRIDLNNQLLDSLKAAGVSSDGDIDQSIKELDDKYGGSIEAEYQRMSRIQQQKLIYDALQREMDLANTAINTARNEINSVSSQLASGKREYEEGLKQYQQGVIEFNIEMEKAEAEIRKAYQDLEELPEAKWIILDRDSQYSNFMFANNAKQMGAIGYSLPVLFYLVAALVCMTTMTRLVDEQRGQIGIFRALGFSNAQIIWKYVSYGLLATLIGSFIGIFVGMAIFPTVIYNAWRLMYDLPKLTLLFPVQFVIICILAFSLLVSIVTSLVVKGTIREMPSQLMRPKAPKNARKVFLEYIGFIWDRLSFTSKITARNLIRYKARFFMTVIGVAGCTSLLVVGWGIRDSISDVVALQFGRIFNHNYIVNLENDNNITEIRSILDEDLDNEYIAPYMAYNSMAYLEKDEKTINVVVVDAREGNDVFKLFATDKKSELRIKNNGVIVTEKFAENYGVEAGDYITIESRNGIKKQVKVNEICEMYFQHYLFISEDYYRSIFDEPVHYTNIAVKNTGSSDFIDQLKQTDGVLSIANYNNVVEQFNIMISALNYIIAVIIMTAGSLAFVVLINLTQVNISERIREIATLKVLGFRTGEVESYIFKEIMLLSVIGGLLGLPLGVVEHRFIMGVINMEMIMFGMNVKPISFVFAYGLTLVFTLIVLLMTKKPLKKVEMIESLKSVE